MIQPLTVHLQLEEGHPPLGASWSDAMEECFDLELATDSLRFYDAGDVPKIDGPIPAAVAEVRFTSDLSSVSPLDDETIRSAGGLFAAL